MTPRRFIGTPVSDGAAVGQLYLADVRPEIWTAATADEVAAAFAAVAADRAALAGRLRAAGRDEAADIVTVAALIAADPGLVDPAVAAVQAGTDAATAVRQAAEAQAGVLAALPSPELADRAGDVRQIGQAVLEQLAGAGGVPRPDAEFILVRKEVAAADLIELAEHGLVGAASVAGGGSSHAAIIARGLGLPMVTGIDPEVLETSAGARALLSADGGVLIVHPGPDDLDAVRADIRLGGVEVAPGEEGGPAATKDGQPVTLLCNVASAAEVRLGLAAGAAGVGLLRTEIPYIAALDWPSREQQARQLAPILGPLAGRLATVRLLDFSGDKIPPFLPPAVSGLAALLGHPSALADQLGAVLAAGRSTELAILVPMVSALAEVTAVRAALGRAAAQAGCSVPRLGIMVELAATAAAAERFAPAVDFFSIGTNDLTGQVLGLGRGDPAASPALAADPRVLTLIRHVVDAAATAGISVSVCGDSAADPLVLPLLIGLGIRTVSVPAAAVSRVRSWIGLLDARACAALAAKAESASSVRDALDLVRGADLG
jgi:phosphoenolpyruvate-protein kinase (PTS system EI component)